MVVTNVKNEFVRLDSSRKIKTKFEKKNNVGHLAPSKVDVLFINYECCMQQKYNFKSKSTWTNIAQYQSK